MNSDNVRRQVAMLAAQWKAFTAPERFQMTVSRIEHLRNFTDDDLDQAVGVILDTMDSAPTVAVLVSTMRDVRAQRLEARASEVRKEDNWLPRMVITERTCARKGCTGHPEMILDVPEPGQPGRAQARLWCPECRSAQPIERDIVTGTIRYWLDYDEVDELFAEPHELYSRPTQGYHHLAELLASKRRTLPNPDASGAAPLRTIRDHETRRSGDLVGIGDLLGDLAAEPQAVATS